MKGLALFRRTNQRGLWNLASYHDPKSITWSWILAFALFRGDERRVWPLWFSHPLSAQMKWGFRIPFMGMITWSVQEKMPRPAPEIERELWLARKRKAPTRIAGQSDGEQP